MKICNIPHSVLVHILPYVQHITSMLLSPFALDFYILHSLVRSFVHSIALNYCVPIRRDFVTRNSCYSIALFHLDLLFCRFSIASSVIIRNFESIFSMHMYYIVHVQLFVVRALIRYHHF